MSRILTLLLALITTVAVSASSGDSKPDTSHRVTVFPSWQEAVVTLATGKKLLVPQANIFLKRSTLIYNSSRGKAMEVPVRNLLSVEIGGRHYERIDSMLFYRVDTVGQNALFCCTRINMDALQQQIINSRVMTNIQFDAQMLNTSTLGVDAKDMDYPIVNIYYYRYRGRWVRAHDRELWRVLPKSKQQDYRIALSLPGFSWTNRESLMDLLRRISQPDRKAK